MFRTTVDHDPDTGIVLLPIDPVDVVQPRTALLHDSVRFDPKQELHITVIGHQQADQLKQQGFADLVAATLARLPKHWRIRPLGRWFLVDDPEWESAEGGDRKGRSSMIEMVHCMEGERFFAELSRQADQEIPLPPFHVTRFVHGDPDGIGLPDSEALDRLGSALEENPI